MPDLILIAIAIFFGTLIGFPLGKLWERRRHAPQFPPPASRFPLPASGLLPPQTPPPQTPRWGQAPPPIVAGIARQVDGEVFIALVPFERQPSTKR